MCTAVSLEKTAHYFGRNLDLDCSYGEQVCITPRNFPFPFRRRDTVQSHFAMIGMATLQEGYPLYYDAVNEHGLCMAGLNFPGNTFYPEESPSFDSITPFEFIPWILGQCKTVRDARKLLARIRLMNIPFNQEFPLSPLHWMIADKDGSIVVESMADGLHIYDDPVGVLTNNPPFPYHLQNLSNYRGLSVANPENRFSSQLELPLYCAGLGALGLPGDLSSMSRFVRMAFHSQNAKCPDTEEGWVSQMFHLLGAVEMPRGSCLTDTGRWDITVYSSCISADTGRYYYTTYDNRRITCVDMHREDLDGSALTSYDLVWQPQILYQN